MGLLERHVGRRAAQQQLHVLGVEREGCGAICDALLRATTLQPRLSSRGGDAVGGFT